LAPAGEPLVSAIATEAAMSPIALASASGIPRAMWFVTVLLLLWSRRYSRWHRGVRGERRKTRGFPEHPRFDSKRRGPRREEDQMNEFDLVIAGGGLAAARAVKSYREAGGRGRIALLSKEGSLPYHRPALSKEYLRGETDEEPFVEDERFYRELDVEVLLGVPVASVDPGARTVADASGTRYRFEKLLIATGAEPRRLDVPGADLDGLFALRTLADSRAIRDAARSGTRAVVIGGGFIGMEVAASLSELGVGVTLVELGERLFTPLGCAPLSDELASLYRAHGVELVFGEAVTAFEGMTQVAAVTTTSGRRIDADLAVVGIGVVPSIGGLAGSGLRLDNGVVVDDRLETDAEGVYAVGDVANFFDPLYRRHRRIEHWSNANDQGSLVGRILAGEDARYDKVSSFFTDLFDVSVNVFGDVARFDALEMDGSLSDGQLLITYGDRGRLVGALTAGQEKEVETRLKELIKERAPVTAVYGGHELAAAR
jgi:3-phenylpropionate/trans-cinnamate dioxygenase ferredoxin reductase component